MMTFSVQELQTAAEAASVANDHGRSVELLRSAAEESSGAEKIRLIEAAALAARHIPHPESLDPWLLTALASPLSARDRGHVLFARSLVLGFRSDNLGERTRVLLHAREALRIAGDDRMGAIVHGALALPLGDELSLPERIALGEEGLHLAARANDNAVRAHCAGNLANSKLLSGDMEAFTLWREAVDVLQPIEARREDALRYLSQWTSGALAVGRYEEAAGLIRRGLARAVEPLWRATFLSLEALLRWRIGGWDAARTAAASALAAGTSPQPGALAVMHAVDTERVPRTPVDALARAQAQSRQRLTLWATTTAMLVRERSLRREPGAARAARDVVEHAMRIKAVLGWEDILPVVAAADATACRTLLAMSAAHPPMGPRAEASMLAARGILEQEADALHDAASSFERLGEPLGRAHMLVECARVLVRDGKRAGEMRLRAAEIYRDLGAERSLAMLVRSSKRTRALEGFRVPPSQIYASNPGLTAREHAVAKLAMQGFTAAEIAASLGVSVTTARTHLARVKSKLGARRKRDLVRMLTEQHDAAARPLAY